MKKVYLILVLFIFIMIFMQSKSTGLATRKISVEESNAYEMRNVYDKDVPQDLINLLDNNGKIAINNNNDCNRFLDVQKIFCERITRK